MRLLGIVSYKAGKTNKTLVVYRKDYQFYTLIWRNWQYASDLSSDGGNTVWVRLPLSAPKW